MIRTPPSRTLWANGNRPAVRSHSITSRQPPHVRPSTDRDGPYQAHGSVGSRSPNDSRARGSPQSMPMSSAWPGSVISRVSPVVRAARQRPCVDVVHAGSRARGAPVTIPRRSWRRRSPRASGGCWCCRSFRGTAWDRSGGGRRRGEGHADLVLPADDGQDRADLRVGERGVDVRRPLHGVWHRPRASSGTRPGRGR